MHVCSSYSHKNSISNFISHLVIKHNTKGNRKIDFLFSLKKTNKATILFPVNKENWISSINKKEYFLLFFLMMIHIIYFFPPSCRTSHHLITVVIIDSSL